MQLLDAACHRERLSDEREREREKTGDKVRQYDLEGKAAFVCVSVCGKAKCIQTRNRARDAHFV